MHRFLLSTVLSLSVLLSTLVAAHAAEYTFTTLDIPSEGGNNAAIALAIMRGISFSGNWWGP